MPLTIWLPSQEEACTAARPFGRFHGEDLRSRAASFTRPVVNAEPGGLQSVSESHSPTRASVHGVDLCPQPMSHHAGGSSNTPLNENHIYRCIWPPCQTLCPLVLVRAVSFTGKRVGETEASTGAAEAMKASAFGHVAGAVAVQMRPLRGRPPQPPTMWVRPCRRATSGSPRRRGGRRTAHPAELGPSDQKYGTVSYASSPPSTLAAITLGCAGPRPPQCCPPAAGGRTGGTRTMRIPRRVDPGREVCRGRRHGHAILHSHSGSPIQPWPAHPTGAVTTSSASTWPPPSLSSTRPGRPRLRPRWPPAGPPRRVVPAGGWLRAGRRSPRPAARAGLHTVTWLPWAAAAVASSLRSKSRPHDGPAAVFSGAGLLEQFAQGQRVVVGCAGSLPPVAGQRHLQAPPFATPGGSKWLRATAGVSARRPSRWRPSSWPEVHLERG